MFNSATEFSKPLSFHLRQCEPELSSSAQKKTKKKKILVGYENKTLDAALRRRAERDGGVMDDTCGAV